MLDGMLRAALGVLGITPDEAKSMAFSVVENVKTVDARLARIEAALGIQNSEPLVLEGEQMEPENEHENNTGNGAEYGPVDWPN